MHVMIERIGLPIITHLSVTLCRCNLNCKLSLLSFVEFVIN